MQRLSLQTDQHANAPWPWEELIVHNCDINQLLRLPDPSGPGAPRLVVCDEVFLDSKELQVRCIA